MDIDFEKLKGIISSVPWISIFIGAVFCAISWHVSRHFYKKSSMETPEWAKPIIAEFGNQRPSKHDLLRWVQEHIEEGEISVHDELKIVACPNCNGSIDNIKAETIGGDARVTIMNYTCSSCGWSQVLDL